MVSAINLDSTISNYAVFGNPVKHSKSPQIHSLFAEQKGITLNYQAIEVPIESFNKYVNLFAEQKGKGLNITVPFKEEAFSLSDSLTQRAKLAGSVNTIWFDDKKNIHGDTTDGQGLINDLKNNHQLNLNKENILILGAGGSVKAILEPLLAQNPEKIIIANRTLARAEELVDKFSDLGNLDSSSFSDLENKSFDLVINGTSLSLKGELPPLPDTLFKNNACSYDLMYSDMPTVFMQWSEKNGASKVFDGLGMLVEQAAEAFNIWHGVMPDTMPVIKRLRK